MKLAIAILALLAASIPGARLHAQVRDPQDGLALAQRVCSDCHAVDRNDVRSPNPRAPTFRELASTSGMTATALTVAFSTPHAGMPMFRLTADQAGDLIAYILSLR